MAKDTQEDIVLLRFKNLGGLFAFFQAAQMDADAITSKDIRCVSDSYWISAETDTKSGAGKALAMAYRETDLFRQWLCEPIPKDEHSISMFKTAERLHLSGKLFVDIGRGIERAELSEEEFLLTAPDEKALQFIVSFFFQIDKTNLRVFAQPRDQTRQPRIVVWIVGYKNGIPLPFVLNETVKGFGIELFLRIQPSPPGQLWFVSPFEKIPYRPLTDFALTPGADSIAEPCYIAFHNEVRRFDRNEFIPLSKIVSLRLLDPIDSLYTTGEIVKNTETIHTTLRLRSSPESVELFHKQSEGLRKKEQELRHDIERVRRLIRIVSERQTDLFLRNTCLYCYNPENRGDKEAFYKILYEKTLQEKSSLHYSRSPILGMGENRIHIIANGQLFTSIGSSEVLWQVTCEYKPHGQHQGFYQHPEWKSNGFKVFVPENYDLVPPIDAQDPTYHSQLLSLLVPSDGLGSLKVTESDKETIEKYLEENFFILRPAGEGYRLNRNLIENLKLEGVPQPIVKCLESNLNLDAGKKLAGTDRESFIQDIARIIGPEFLDSAAPYIPLIADYANLEGTILTTVIPRNQFHRLSEMYHCINLDVHGFREAEQVVVERSFDWISDEMRRQSAHRLKEIVEKISLLEADLSRSDASYQWKLTGIKEKMSKRLEEGKQELIEIHSKIDEFKALRIKSEEILAGYKELFASDLSNIKNRLKDHLWQLKRHVDAINGVLKRDEQIRTDLNIRLTEESRQCSDTIQGLIEGLIDMEARL
jgi:hypothetical protein